MITASDEVVLPSSFPRRGLGGLRLLIMVPPLVALGFVVIVVRGWVLRASTLTPG